MKRPRGSASSIHRRLLARNMGDKTDLKYRHVVWPTVYSISLISICVLLIDENKYPPMIISLVAATIFAPLLAIVTKSGEIKEHIIGVALVCIPMAGLWFFGPNYFNIAIPFLIWVWQCASWSKRDHPPIRYGVWHGFGIASTILPGAILIGTLL